MFRAPTLNILNKYFPSTQITKAIQFHILNMCHFSIIEQSTSLESCSLTIMMFQTAGTMSLKKCAAPIVM